MKDMRYCGKVFISPDIELIKGVIAEDSKRTRADISRIVCRKFGWYKPDGGLKDMSCKVVLLRMQKDALIKLPPPRIRNGNGRVHIKYTPATEAKGTVVIAVEGMYDLCLKPVMNKKDSYLWNEYIARYHYLGYKPLPGAQMRYFAISNGQITCIDRPWCISLEDCPKRPLCRLE